MATQTEQTVVYAAGVVQCIAAAAGGVIACYQLGYAIAAFGVGPVVDSGVELSMVYGLAAIVAAAMGLVSFVVVGRRPSAPSLHTRVA